jgi:hypothetical protein
MFFVQHGEVARFSLSEQIVCRGSQLNDTRFEFVRQCSLAFAPD